MRATFEVYTTLNFTYVVKCLYVLAALFLSSRDDYWATKNKNCIKCVSFRLLVCCVWWCRIFDASFRRHKKKIKAKHKTRKTKKHPKNHKTWNKKIGFMYKQLVYNAAGFGGVGGFSTHLKPKLKRNMNGIVWWWSEEKLWLHAGGWWHENEIEKSFGKHDFWINSSL